MSRPGSRCHSLPTSSTAAQAHHRRPIAWALALFLAGGLAVATPVSAPELDGKVLFEREKCNLCHANPAVGIEAEVKSEKMLGPELPTAEPVEDGELLIGYLRQKEEIDGKKHKKGFKGSDEELGALIAWLESLREDEAAEADTGADAGQAER